MKPTQSDCEICGRYAELGNFCPVCEGMIKRIEQNIAQARYLIQILKEVKRERKTTPTGGDR